MINEPGREIPEKTLLVVPNQGISNEEIATLLQPLDGVKQRNWFNPHFYYCLPLTVANQYGFIVRAQRDFSIYWDGGSSNASTRVMDTPVDRPIQKYSSHFGEGTVTIQNYWHYRTAPGVNLMTINPPNFVQHGLTHMTGVIETDNLRRDFTFNLKMTRPHGYVEIKAGEPVGAFIPIPRWYADQFKIAYANELYSDEEIQLEHATGAEFARQRMGEDLEKPRQAGRRYFKGEDAWGTPFKDHQR